MIDREGETAFKITNTSSGNASLCAPHTTTRVSHATTRAAVCSTL